MSARALLVAVVLVAACSGGGDERGSRPDPASDDPFVAADGYEAEVIRTGDGVAHIRAASLDDVIFGQGWASSEDRPCDLLDQVIKVRGERARFFGARHAASDIGWLATGIFDLASEDFADAREEVVAHFDAFADGWNAQFDAVGADGLTGWCAGEDWVRPVEPVEVYAYARSLALQASSGAIIGYLAGATPPDPSSPATEASEDEAAAALASITGRAGASNGWAIGADRSIDGGGMLVGNPHFPWEGALRFSETHLTVPGELDIYGVQLTGVPGIGIGFTDTFAWTHTVSSGSRFTGYTLDLVDGDPTSYHHGDEVREMTSTDVTIQVLEDDGSLTGRTETLWRSHHGPIVSVPGIGWTTERAVAVRDANIDNDEFVEQYVAMNQADDLDELIDAHRRHTGVPSFNTIAVSDDGRAWYADTSATPNLSDQALARWDEAKELDIVVALAARSGLVLLDGSDPGNEWVVADGARDPGLVPFDRMPVRERTDHVFNANDSYWLSHADEVLDGDFSPLHGAVGEEQSVRTRQNAVVLGDLSADGPSGPDGRFDRHELRDLAVDNTGRTAVLLREQVVERCRSMAGIDGVDLTAACDVLDRWDDRYDLDSVGVQVWRELLVGLHLGSLWAVPFDPADPVGTPRGLVDPPSAGPDPVLARLAEVVRILDDAGVAVDARWGDLQFADRGGVRVAVHGGSHREGVTNVVGWGPSTTLEPLPRRSPPVSDDAELRPDGYGVSSGTSFLFAVHFGTRGPVGDAFLTYSNTGDRDADIFHTATQRFSDKRWRPIAFRAEDVDAAAESRVTVTG